MNLFTVAVRDTADLFEDPQLVARGFVKSLDHKQHGKIRLLGSPLRLSASEVEITAAPLLGEHTTEVVSEDLGLDADGHRGLDMDDLEMLGVDHNEPRLQSPSVDDVLALAGITSVVDVSVRAAMLKAMQNSQ